MLPRMMVCLQLLLEHRSSEFVCLHLFNLGPLSHFQTLEIRIGDSAAAEDDDGDDFRPLPFIHPSIHPLVYSSCWAIQKIVCVYVCEMYNKVEYDLKLHGTTKTEKQHTACLCAKERFEDKIILFFCKLTKFFSIPYQLNRVFPHHLKNETNERQVAKRRTCSRVTDGSFSEPIKFSIVILRFIAIAIAHHHRHRHLHLRLN